MVSSHCVTGHDEVSTLRARARARVCVLVCVCLCVSVCVCVRPRVSACLSVCLLHVCVHTHDCLSLRCARV